MPLPALQLHPALPNLLWVRAALVPAVVFIATIVDRGYQTDFWQHLARGQLIAAEGEIVSVDRFTFTVPDRPMRDNNWLSQLLYLRLFTLGGIELVQLVNSLTLAAAAAVVVWTCRRECGSLGLAAAGGVFLFLGLWQTFLIRPQSFSLLLFALLHALLLAPRRDRRLLLLPPLMLALWANVHGGFAIGLLLIGAFTLAAGVEWGLATVRARIQSEAISKPPFANAPSTPGAEPSEAPDLFENQTALIHARSCSPTAPSFPEVCILGLTFLASIAATLLNPYGWRVYAYAADLSRLGLERGIEEWLPPGPELLVSRVFYASLALLVGLLIVSRRRSSIRDIILLALFLPPALLAVRMVPWWLLVVTPLLSSMAADAIARITSKPPPRPRPSLAATAMLAMMLLVAVLCLPWLDRFNPAIGALRPAGRAEDGLRQVGDALAAPGAPGRIFARFEWANYLCWSLGAKRAVFMEGHVELYPDDLWEQYLVISTGGAGWDRALDQYEVDALLLDQTYHEHLLRRVRKSNQWQETAKSADAVLFVRREPSLVATVE